MATSPAHGLARLVAAINSGDVRSVLCVLGAGVSVAAGIPDFRTPGSGLYSRLEEYHLPYPEAVFELAHFERNPQPFFKLARGLWPGHFTPTRAHHFLRLLADKQVLRRVYTQNIDTLERAAHVPGELLVEAHGSFASASCRRCRARYDQAWLAAALRLPLPGQPVAEGATAAAAAAAAADARAPAVIPRCAAPRCGGVVKPDIVFFGEDLPARFHALWKADVAAADCVLVMGTSLAVHPIAGLPVSPLLRARTPRVAVNREPLWRGPRSGYRHGEHAIRVTAPADGPVSASASAAAAGRGSGGGGHSPLGRYVPGVDVMLHGDADDGVTALARALGWERELERLEAAWHSAAGRGRGVAAAIGVGGAAAVAAAAAAAVDARGGEEEAEEEETEESGSATTPRAPAASTSSDGTLASPPRVGAGAHATAAAAAATAAAPVAAAAAAAAAAPGSDGGRGAAGPTCSTAAGRAGGAPAGGAPGSGGAPPDTTDAEGDVAGGGEELVRALREMGLSEPTAAAAVAAAAVTAAAGDAH